MIEIARILYLRFTMIYGDKFTKDYPTDDFVRMWWEDWAEGLVGIEPLDMKNAIDYCKLNLKWPPTMAEFIDLCDKSSGLPDAEEAMQLAIKRDFTKPIVRILFDKITSYNMANDTETVLRKKFKDLYQKEVANFRQERQKQFLLEKGISNENQITYQGRSLDNNEHRSRGVQKIESYLPH